MEERVVVYETVDPLDAKIIRMALSRSSIESVVDNEETLDITGPCWNTFAPLTVKVLVSQKEQASFVVAKHLKDKQRIKLKDGVDDSYYKEASNFLKWFLIALFGFAIYMGLSNPHSQESTYATTFSEKNNEYHPHEQNSYLGPILTLLFLLVVFVALKTSSSRPQEKNETAPNIATQEE